MKKTVLILICAFLIMSVFASCKDKDTNDDEQGSSEITTQTTTTTTTVTNEVIPDSEEDFGQLIPIPLK